MFNEIDRIAALSVIVGIGAAFSAALYYTLKPPTQPTQRTQDVDKNLTIATYIKQFVNDRATSNEPHFFANALREFVSTNSGTIPAPGTTDRILRKLRQKGEIDYAVENRKLSYYLAKPVVK
jgi:hypothetical protein